MNYPWKWADLYNDLPSYSYSIWEEKSRDHAPAFTLWQV